MTEELLLGTAAGMHRPVAAGTVVHLLHVLLLLLLSPLLLLLLLIAKPLTVDADLEAAVKTQLLACKVHVLAHQKAGRTSRQCPQAAV